LSRATPFPRHPLLQVAALAALAEFFLPAVAGAQSSGNNAECRSNPHLARARELYEELQFDEAASTLQRAIEYANNCRWDLGEIYRLKAFVDAVNGERERCHRDFEIFLALTPDYEMPPDTPPKIKSCFDDAKQVAPSRRELNLEHDVAKEVQPNAPVPLKVKVIDPLRLVDQVKVYFRREGVKVFTVVSARADDNVSIVIPALAVTADPEGYKIEYMVRAVDRWDGVLVEQGGPRRPLAFKVLPGGSEGGPIFEKWWFWTAVVGAIAGATALVLLTQQQGPTVTLVLHDKGTGG
jgi:hypothetical protein